MQGKAERKKMTEEKDKQKLAQPVLLRPHHGMCLAYFKGEGYSDGFSAHMKEVLDIKYD